MELSTSRLRLSIGIPTYNGSEYIREALDSIVSQLNDIEEKIEIVISDNASTDKTPMIIDEYKERYPGIFSYFRNEMDLGPDRNIDLSVRRSKGEYVWLFSDDDKMLEGSLKKVLSVLEENRNIAAIFVNWQSASLDLKQQYKIGRYGITSKSDIFCKTADDFLHTVRLTPVLLSSNIVNRSLWEKTDNSIYMGSFWIQFATLLSLLPGNSSYCISKPYVLYRYNNLRWDKHGEKNLKNTISLMRIINAHSSKYSRKSVRRTVEVMFSSLPREILVSRSNSIVFKPYTLKFIKEFKKYPFFWFFIFPLMFLPSNLCTFIYNLRKSLINYKRKNET